MSSKDRLKRLNRHASHPSSSKVFWRLALLMLLAVISNTAIVEYGSAYPVALSDADRVFIACSEATDAKFKNANDTEYMQAFEQCVASGGAEQAYQEVIYN